MNKAVEQALNNLYKEAKKCPVKRRLYVYEQYKRELERLDLTSMEYTEACRNIANYLEV